MLSSQKFTANFAIFLFVYSLMACVTGPKDPHRTFAEKLNGENYESNKAVVMGVPVIERKPIQRKFSGHVFCGEGATQTPANHATISIVKGNELITSTTTDTTGSYVVTAPLDPKLNYTLSASSPCGQNTKNFSKVLKDVADENFYLVRSN